MGQTHGDESHGRYDGMAVEHVLGGLGEADGRLFRAHLLECGSCRANVGELRAIAHELADVERDEARARAVQQLETKQRDEVLEQAAPATPRRMFTPNRLVVVALLGVIILLAAWVFVLRGQVGELEQRLDTTRDVAAAPDVDDSWELDTADGVTGELRESGDALVVMADALPDVGIEVTAYDPDGEVLLSDTAEVDDGHFLVLLRDLGAPLARVTLVAPSLPDDEATLLEARLAE